MGRTIGELSNDAYRNMGSIHQITIDLIQDVEDYAGEDNNATKDDFGAKAYQIDVLLDVFDPNLDSERKYLKELLEICRKRSN